VVVVVVVGVWYATLDGWYKSIQR